MPCPYFEPTSVAESPSFQLGRFPLIHEYEGKCHAGGGEPRSPVATRLRCNMAYSDDGCSRLAPLTPRTASRYTVVGHAPDALEILCITEIDHVPEEWRRVRYDVACQSVTPDFPSIAIRAQVLAFCRSFLARYPER